MINIETRSKVVSIRFTEDEHELLKKEAKENGLRLPSYLRLRILKQEREPINSNIKYSPNIQPRKNQIRIGFTDDELAYISNEASRLGIPIGSYIAHALKEQIIIQFPENLAEDIKGLNQQILKVGTNLNQLTKLANMGVITTANVDDVKEVYINTLVKLNEVNEVINNLTYARRKSDD